MLKLTRHSPDTFPGSNVLPLKQWQFPAGEAGIKIETTDWIHCYEASYTIHLLWEGNNDLFALAQLVDALHGMEARSVELYIPYFPYARQDRRCAHGEGHSLRVAAQFVNSLKLDRVIVEDPHSYVLEALLERAQFVPQNVCAKRLPKYDYLIAPDAGAAKKIMAHQQVVDGHAKVLIADKARDGNGNITHMVLPGYEQLHGMTACVVDDICDGGATFIKLVDETADAMVAPVLLDLYVTHGLFTKGLDALRQRYHNIYTRNLLNPALKGQVKEI